MTQHAPTPKMKRMVENFPITKGDNLFRSLENVWSWFSSYSAEIKTVCNTHNDLVALLTEYQQSDDPVGLYQDSDFRQRIATTLAKVKETP